MILTRQLAPLLLCATCWLCGARAHAWIYPEHRRIGVDAWERLEPESRAFYAALWARVRHGYSAGLCEAPVSGDHAAAGSAGSQEPCIDFPAWPAIAGDHSCSPNDLIDNVLPGRWVHDVARVSEEVAAALREAESASEHENIWITSNLKLQDVDPGYVTRAGANNAHFLLPMGDEDVQAFIALSERKGAPLNALGLYVQYHAAALRLAGAIGPDASRAGTVLARRVLALEAYALHFLQDMFASGHVAGTWGDVASRKGTHDYYCAHGYSTTTWAGETLIMYGDAHMRPADLARAGGLMAASMEQLVAAAARAPAGYQPVDRTASEVAGLDSCQRLEHPETIPLSNEERAQIEALVRDTPRPGHGPDSAAWPRYHADFGLFLGFSSSMSLGVAGPGYGGRAVRGASEFGLALRVGYALEGVVAAINTGTMYAQLGFVRQGDQRDICTPEPCELDIGTRAFPRVPSRGGITLGLRMPFWLIPGDLLVLAPVLALASPSTLTQVAIRAASGGLIPWQRTFATPLGYLEFVAGRVVHLTLHGGFQRLRTLARYDEEDQRGLSIGETGLRALAVHFPLVELTPFRAFAQTLSASVSLQLVYAVDIPFDTVRYDTNLPGPDWPLVHMGLLRININGRGYL